MDPSILVAPVLTEVVSAGKGLLIRLTDYAGIAVYSGSKMATAVMRQIAGPGDHWLGLTVPIHIAKRSRAERCLLRYFSMELIGLGDVYTPFDGDVKLIGAYKVSSLDFIKREASISAKLLRQYSEDELEKLNELRARERSVLESILIEPQKLETIFVEFRCPLGKSYPGKFEGGFRARIFADVIFPSVVSKAEVELLTFDHSFSIELVANTVDITTLGKSDVLRWETLTPLGESLKCQNT